MKILDVEMVATLTMLTITIVSFGQAIDVQEQGDQHRRPRVQQPAQPRADQQNQEQRLLQMAKRYEEMADFERARDTYRQLAEQRSNNPIYYQGVLRNSLYLKDYDQALSWIVRYMPQGVGRHPGDPLSVFALEIDRGEVLYKMELADSAFGLWNRALSEVGFEPNAYAKVVRTMTSNRLMVR